MNEFEIINHYFKHHQTKKTVLLGIGDDAAIIQPPAHEQLIVAVDTLVAGRHFPDNALGYDIACRSLLCNISDFAAMGACPKWFTLALTLPTLEPNWLTDFSNGLHETAQQFDMALIGGDTTKGPLTISLQLIGHTLNNQALTRSNAQLNDDIYVSGTLGNAAYALNQLDCHHEHDYWKKSYYYPEPRLELGQQLLKFANSAIDISDGLVADLGHICQQSNVYAEIYLSQLPLSSQLKQAISIQDCYHFALTGGDDYELCFTAHASQRKAIHALAKQHNISLTCIGKITADNDIDSTRVQIYDAERQKIMLEKTGYKHFD